MKGKLLTTANLVRMAMLAGVSLVLMQFDIPIIAFYKLDFSALPVLIGGLAMGPIAGVIILAVKCLLDALMSQSLGIGQLADFVCLSALILPAAVIYRRNRTRKTALWGLLTGTLCIMAVGAVFNYLVLIPFYVSMFGWTSDKVIGLVSGALPFVDTMEKFVLFVTAPFNLLKGLTMSVLTYFLYKPLSPLLTKGNR